MRVAFIGVLIAPLICAGCVDAGDDGTYGLYGDRPDYGASTPTGSDVSSSESDARDEERHEESSRVINGQNGTTYVFHESNGDTDVVHLNGDVTTVIHDSDGTVTTVGPDGVHVDVDDGDDHRGHHDGE